MSEKTLAPVGHSPAGFSGAYRWTNCTASLPATRGLPDVSTPEAERGTLLHEISAALLVNGPLPAGAMTLTDEERKIVRDYVMHVLERQLETGAELLVEHKFHLQGLHQLLWGTADAVLIADRHCEVIDLKSGGGVLVRPRNDDGSINEQLGGYLLGALMTIPHRIDTCSITIVQPRREGIVSTDVDLLELEELADRYVRALRESEENPTYRPGGWCRFCRAKDGCRAYQDQALNEAQALFHDDPD